MLLVANAGRFGLLALALFTVSTLMREARMSERAVALAVEADDVRMLCRRAGCRESSFYERLRAIGVMGLALRPEPLARLVASKAVLRFNEEEVAKLKETGMLNPEAPLKAGTIFVRDERVRTRLLGAARAQRLSLVESRYGSKRVLDFSAGIDLESVSAGYDPALAAAAGAAGLTAVYRASASEDLRLALEPLLPSAALLDGPTAAFSVEVMEALAKALAERRIWGAAPAAEAGEMGLLPSIELPIGTPVAEFLRLVSDLGSALVILRIDPLAPPQAALSDLRRLSRGLREAGAAPSWPSRLFESRRPGAGERTGRKLLAALAAVLGPLWALRLGLSSARRMARSRVLPEATPLREACVGLLSVAACLGVSGAVVRALLADGIGASGSGGLAVALTASGAFAGIWMSDAAKWDLLRRRDRDVLLRLALAAAGVAFLIAPPSVLARSAFGLRALAAWRPAWWWAPAHWPEVIVGIPALFVGLCLYAESLRLSVEKRSGATDPRPWLFAGVVGSAGVVQALARPGMPFLALFLQYSHCLALGSFFGVLLWLGNERRRNHGAA